MIESLHILLPGLFSHDFESPEDAHTHLKRLLSKATVAPDKPACLESGLKYWFSGLASGELPTGALGALSHNLIDKEDKAIWLRADPVIFRADVNQVFCLGNEMLALTPQENQALSEQLKTYFDQEGMELFAPNGHSWYLRLGDSPDVVTNALADVAGKGIQSMLPSGPDQAIWHRRLTEVQMILKNHPVNVAREQAGQLPANALWFWGLGRLPRDLLTEFDCFVSKSFIMKGLAHIAGKHYIDTSTWPSLQDTMSEYGFVRGAYVEDGLIAANRFANNALRNTVLEAFDRSWAKPILHALQEGDLKQCLIDDCQGQRYFITKRHLRYFWRKNQQALSF